MSGSMVSLLFLIFQFLSVYVQPQTTTSTPTTTTEEFILRGFRGNKSEIILEGAATIEPDGLLRLTDRKSNVTGTAFYSKPVRLLDHNTQAKVCSFSTSFVFLIVPSSSSNGGFGFTFTLSPTPNRPGAQPGHYFGLVNQSNDGNQTNHVFAVKFDTVIDGTDAKSNHVGLNFNSVASDIEELFAYYDDNERKKDFPLDSVPIRVRLDFDGPTETLNLIVSPARIAIAPSTPLISRRVPKMSEIVQKEMYVGFTASTGEDKLSSHYLLGWSFRSSRDGLTADRLVLQDLPLWHLNTGNKKGFQAMVTKILIATSLIVSILVVGVLAFLIRKKSLPNVQRRKNLKALILLKHYRYNEVKRFTNSFACVIGKGGFGTVYKGNLPDGRPVAVKVLKDSKGNCADFINEVTSMSQTSHVNIVSLVGFCYEGSKRVIVYEFLENGSLDQFISSIDSLSVEKLYEIALGVARGLEYLHYGCKTRIVHFDIKPQNVLLDCNLCPKVSDFGLAKLCEKKESIMSLMETRGTIGYIAPEMISRVYGSVSHKSDVYSYGMLVLEMIGATRNDRDENAASNSSSIYFPDWIYKDLENGQCSRILGEELTRGKEEITKKMILVSLWCIQSCPSNRPSMNRVVEMMEGSLDALEVPPRPVFQIPIAPLQESSTFSGDISIHTEE